MITDKQKKKDRRQWLENIMQGQDVIIMECDNGGRTITFKQPIKGVTGKIIYMNDKNEVIDII